jgi:hypothetical protein
LNAQNEPRSGAEAAMRRTVEAVPASGVLESNYRLATPSRRRSERRLFGSVGPAQSCPPFRRRFAGLTWTVRFRWTAFIGASAACALTRLWDSSIRSMADSIEGQLRSPSSPPAFQVRQHRRSPWPQVSKLGRRSDKRLPRERGGRVKPAGNDMFRRRMRSDIASRLDTAEHYRRFCAFGSAMPLED